MKRLPQSRIVDTHREPTDEEYQAMMDAENDPEWQLQRQSTEQWCADRNAASDQQCQQEIEAARPWWQKIL